MQGVEYLRSIQWSLIGLYENNWLGIKLSLKFPGSQKIWTWPVPAFFWTKVELASRLFFLPLSSLIVSTKTAICSCQTWKPWPGFKNPLPLKRKKFKCWDMSSVIGRKGSLQQVGPLPKCYKHWNQIFSTPWHISS